MKDKRSRPKRSIRDLLRRVKRFFLPGTEPIEPEDPHAYRMAPLRRPPNKGGAAAVAELDEE
jgi:hypothetical protein